MTIEICSNTGVEVKDPRFQALKGKLNDPKMTDYDLGVCLQCYRERFGRDIDWLPSNQDEIDSVIWYIKNVETQEKPVGTTQDLLYEKYTTIRRVYTPSQYNDVIDLLSRSFSKRVDSLFDKSDKSKTRQQLIKEYGDEKANGFERIMQAVFKSYEKLLDVDARMQKFLEKYPNVSDAQKAAQREFFETQAREFKKILDYKGILAAAAAARIGENEGFVVSYDKLDVEFERFEEPEENTPEAEEAQTEDGDKEQDTKGDRYVDYRTVKLMETIAPEAKRFIRGIKKVDSAGRPITNFMGMYTYLNPAQTGVVLKRIISNSSPKSMMQDLRNEADRYPWLRGLITELEKNTDMQTLIYVNFKGAEHVYVYSNREKGHYEQHIANSKAAGNAFVKEAGINMSGFVLSEDSSVYTEFGIIKPKDEIAAIKAKFEDIKGRILSPIGLRYVKMVSGDKPYSKGTLDSVRAFGDANEHDSSHLDYEGAEAMEKFLENNPDILPAVTDALRGLGFDVVEEDVKNAVTQMMSEKSLTYIVGRGKAKSVSTGRNKLYQLVTAIDGLYNAAVKLSDSGKPATGQYFFNTTDGFRTIANCLSSSKYLETEERVVQGNKSLTTHTHVNLLMQVTDDLTNKENKSEEEYQADLERDYLRFEGMSLGYADQRRSVGWLDRFQRNVGGMRDNFRIVDDSGFNGVEYSRLTDVQKMANSIIKYFGLGKLFWASDYAGVEVNIQADYENAYNFALVPKMKVGVLFDESTGKYAPDSELVDALVDEVAIEIERINAIKERSGNKNRAIPKVYEEQGLLFQVFPGFNTNGFLEKLNGIENTADRDAFIRESIVLELSKVLDQDYAAIEKSGVLKNNLLYNATGFSDAHLYAKDGRVSSLSEKAQEMLRDYCLNVFYARLQICKIYTGGLHQFNGIIDYEKRNMLLHAPHSSLYTEATYKGKRVLPEGKDYQTALYINDDTAKSEFFDRIEQSLKELHKRKIITKQQFDAFCEKYKYIKTTDGVGFRTLDSYREMILISDPTSWSDEHDAAYKRIKNGHPKASDIKLFMQGQKLVYSGPEVVAAAEGTLQKPVKLTVLHKYSEEVLLPVELANYCLKMKSAPLKGLAQAVKDLGKDKPDLIIFGSGVKTGSHSVIDPYEKEGKKPDGARLRPDADSIAKYIVEQVKARPYAIHKLPFKYLGIASSTKPHVSNEKISIAAQAEDMMWSNIKSGDKISVRGQNKEATWGRDKYFEIKTAEIIENYQSLCKLFANKYELSKMLREELATKSYVSSELYSAISILEDGTFAMPFYSPNMEHQIQALFSSVIKKRLIKPKGKGANIIQGTGFGMDLDASKFDNANAISEDNKLGFVFDKKTGNFKYVEVTVPLTDTRLLRFADEDGSISAEKLRQLIKDGIIPESMLEFVAYRTPSDAEHSVIPCRIKAFTANVEGATIRMPKEVMVLTGNDFDGDKMRCHFKNFRIVDIEQDTSDENLIDVIFRKKKIKTAWTQKAETVEFDYDKSASEQSSEARYNARVELMFSEATSPEGFLRMIIPGGNDETTILAKTHYLIKEVHSGDEKRNLLKKGLVDLGISESKAAEIVNNNVSLYETLTKMDDGKLSSIIKTVTGAETPFSLAHSLDAFNYIVRNSGMIGTYATMNAAYRKLQRLNMRYVPRNDAEVTIFGHTFGKLFDLENRGKDLSDSEKEKIIGGLLGVMPISRLLNAAVDNGKNPILGYINQTRELAPFTLFLTAAGLTEEDIDLIFNQPAVLALTERIRSAATEGSRDAVSDVIDSLVDELSRNLPSGDVQFGVASKNGTFKSLEKIAGYDKIDFISMLGRSLKEMTDHIEQGYEDVIMQISVLQFLKHLNAPANNLMTLVRLLRPDSDSGTFSSSIASMICKKAELDSFRELLDKEEDQYIGFSGARGIMAKRPVLQGMKSDRIATATKSELPEITSLISLMIEGGLDIVSPYFPQAKASWTPIIEKIANMYDYSKMQEGVLKRIGRDAILFKLLSDKQFIPGDVQEEQKKILYGYKNETEEVKSVPERLGALKKRIAEATAESDPAAFALKGNIFIDNLYFVSPEHSVDGSLRLQFRLSNAAIEDSTDTVRASWGEMLNINDEEIQTLATDLFMYNFYTSGLNYGMYEFSHLVPFSVLMRIPGYLDALNRVLESDWTDEEMERFKQQYQMNHWFEEKLVPNFKSELFDITWDTENKGTLHIAASQKNKLGRFRGKEFAVISFKDYNKYIPYFYSVSRRYVEGEDGKKHLAEIILTPAQMLGFSNYHKQISLSYNPALSASLITRPAPDRVILSDEDLKRAHTAEANIDDMENMQDSAPAPTEAPQYIPPSTGLTAEEDRDLSVKRTTAIASAITDEARSLERLAEVSEGADDSNFDNTEGVPVQEPSSPGDEGLNEVDIQITMNTFGISREMAIAMILKKKKKGSSDKKLYSISVARRDENGKIVKEDVPATPENVREARKQRAYVKLNKLLREILRKKGISVGVLSDAEARMSLSGIADFDTARVTAEGLIELIRIAKGMEGEYALPEEFAHVALEMLGYDNPLVDRLLTALSGNQKALEEAFGDQYEEYIERYENDRNKLVIEAAGKLVAKALLRNEPVQTSGIRRLIDRIVAAIKELLRKFNIFEIRDAISESEDVASQIAKDILSGRLVDYMQVENITSSTAFAKIHKDITDKNDIINKIIKTELKRLNILKKRLADKKKSFSQRSVIFTENQIAKLRRAIVQHKEEAAIADYLATSVEFIRTSQKNLEEGINKGIGTNRICKRLVVLRDTLDSFSAVIDAVNKAIADKEIPDSQNLKESIGLLSSEIGKVYTDTDFIGKAFFQETLADVYGKDGLTISIGKEKGRHVSIKEMSEQSDGDVSFMGRWFHSMADVGDYALRAISELVRSAKRRARLRSDAIRPVIEQAIKDLIKETGSADQSFMFHYKRWNMKEDGREDDGKLHKSGRYLNEKEAEKLSPAQRKFYDTIMGIKKELDKNLPASLVSPLKIVMLRKYSYERYRDAHGLKEKFSTFCEGLKNSILETGDDVDYENKEVAVTFSGNKLDALVPKFTLKGKNETYDDMTDDIATSIMTYANMATEYNEMNDIIGILENARYMSSKRDVIMRTGSKKMRESIGDPEKDDLYYTKPFTVKQAHTRLQEVMDDFFKMHVYNRLHEDEGTFGRTKISKRKLAGFIERMVSLSQMALNLPQRVANVNTGATMIAVESVGKGKFNAKDVWWATRQWMKYSVDRLAETGKTDIANKLSLFNAYHDILQQNGRDIPNYQRGRLSRVFSSNLLYAGLTIGEDFLASTTALAVARNFKVKNQKTGKAGNLFDAYDVKYRDEANKSGAYLALNPDYTKPDGSPITKEDEEAYAKEVIALNFEMQGIYNLDDRSAIQQYALGSMLIMYRKWIAPALKRRYQGLFNNRTSYSIMKGEFEEGYYSTLFHFMTAEGIKDAGYEKISEEQSEEVVHNIINDIKALMVGVSVNWNKLTDYEKANMHKAFTELAIVFGLFASAFLLTKLPPDDHDGNKVLCWADDFVLSNILRLRTELGAQAPTPMFVGEGLKILNSPFAALGPLRDSLKIFQLAIPSNYTTEVKSGRYRGHSKAYKYFRELPIISMFKKIDNFIDPSDLIQYYENEAF